MPEDRLNRHSVAGDAEVNPWIVLAVLCAGVFMMLLDATIVNLAQQDIRTDLGASLSQMQWVLDAYILIFAVLLLTTGRLGDLLGRRRLFVIGVAVFTVASALCAAAGPASEALGVSGANALIGARVLQGVGGALLMPQTIALVAVAFPPERRGAAFGVWSAVTALAGVVGLLLGGAIITYMSWEWIFLINIPLGVPVILLALRFVPESRDPNTAARFDYPGMILSGLGLLAVVFALIEANHFGWTSPLIVASLGSGAALLALFVWREQRTANPMMRMELFRLRNFWTGNIVMAAMNFGFFGILLPLTVLVQGALGFSAMRAGIILVPMAMMITLIAPFAGRLSDRIGSRGLLAGGFVLASAGVLLVINEAHPHSGTLDLVIPIFVLGTGFALVVSQMNVVPLRQVPIEVVGSASGILNTTRSVFQVMGVAALSTIMQHVASNEAAETLSHSALAPSIRAEAQQAVAEGRFSDLVELGGPVEQSLLSAISIDLQLSFIDGFSAAMMLAAASALIGLGATVLIRDRSAEPVVEGRPAAVEAATSGD